MDIADQIQKLHQLRQTGAISEQEYQKAKETLLRQQEPICQKVGDGVRTVCSDPNTWSMFIHLSQFCGYIIPLAGMVVPIVLWQMKKDQSEVIDTHGRIVANWIFTELILIVIFAVLCLVAIGFLLFFLLGILAIAFPIIGGVKAYNGQFWPYPLSIRFFRVRPKGQSADRLDAYMTSPHQKI